MSKTSPNMLLPYPEGTDPVNQGDDIIKALALALDAYTQVPLKAAADLPTAYPVGVSVMTLSSANAAAQGWPLGASATVVTIRRAPAGDGLAHQIWFQSAAGNARVLVRSSSSNSPFGAWGGMSSPYGQASGSATVNLATSPTARVTVTLPTNRFSIIPLVWTQSGSTAWTSGAYNTSLTSFQVEARSLTTAGSGTLPINWLAIQYSDSSRDG